MSKFSDILGIKDDIEDSTKDTPKRHYSGKRYTTPKTNPTGVTITFYPSAGDIERYLKEKGTTIEGVFDITMLSPDERAIWGRLQKDWRNIDRTLTIAKEIMQK